MDRISHNPAIFPARAVAWRRLPIPTLVLLVGLLSTGLASGYVAISVRTKERIRFDGAAERTLEMIRSHLATYVALLRGAQGLFAASDEVTRHDFHAFVDHLELETRYPGIQGIGFSQRLSPDERDLLAARLREQGVEGFKLWPEYPRPEYHSIIYLEPLDWRNQRALGYDMFSEPIRREAMERARDTGRPAASGKVKLVQETEHEPQPGFLIYLPVYRAGTIPATLELRREHLVGFVYSPFRAQDLLRGIFQNEAAPLVTLQVFDGEVSTDRLLYDSTSLPSPGRGQGTERLRTALTLELAGRTWALVMTPGTGLSAGWARHQLPVTVLIGTALSLLLYGTTGWLARMRAAAERSAADLLAENQERRRAEEALRESEERFRATFNQAAVGMALIDLENRFMQVNQRFCDIVGYSQEELAELDWARLTHPDDVGQNMTLRKRLLAGEIPNLSLEKRFLCKDGRIAWVSVSTAMVHDAQGRPSHTISVFRDITARRHAEQTVLEQKRELEDFVSISAHDLKHPVVSVHGLLGVLRKQCGDSLGPDARENLELALSECGRMEDILSQLGQIARIGSAELQMEAVHLPALLHRLVQRFSHVIEQRQVELSIDCPDVSARFPRLQVEEALDNLLDNALLYGCSGPRPRVALICRVEDSMVQIAVQDSGPGIDPRYHQRIFEMFRRLDPAGPVPGTGVGLTAAQRLVRRIGGTIALDSEPDCGATFTLRFPAQIMSTAAARP